MSDRPNGLLAWQWELYPVNHRDRRNLVVHALTEPLFLVGLFSLPVGPLFGHPLAILASLALVVIAVAAQGRGHRLEAEPPVPFRGPFDVVARLFAEQLVTFPRFVLSGGYARAWREAGRPVAPPAL